MPLENESRLKTITDALSLLEVAVKNRAAVGLFDIHRVAENFCAGFLNRLFDLKLKNLNHEYKNASAIDLGDDEAKPPVCYQVTSNSSKVKIQATLDQFIKDNWNSRFERLQVLVLAPRSTPYKGLTIDSRIKFDPRVDVISLTQLGVFAARAEDKVESLAAFAEQQMPVLSAHLSTTEIDDHTALTVYRRAFDRDALHHRFQKEGPMMNFEKALLGLSRLVQDGEMDAKTKAKNRASFDSPDLRAALDDLHQNLSKLIGLFNQHVNTGEINLKYRGYDFHDPNTPGKFNAYKQAVIDSLNKALVLGGLSPIRGVDSE